MLTIFSFLFSILLFIVSFVVAINAPEDILHGSNVGILFVHAPCAWLALIIYFSMAIFSFVSVVWRSNLASTLALASAPVGFMFSILCLATGSFWGYRSWGVWWAWDARMTGMLLLSLFYAGHLSLSHAASRSRHMSDVSSYFILFGIVNIPIIRFSVDRLNTLHQRSSLSYSGSRISPELLKPLLLFASAMLLSAITAVILRFRAIVLRNRLIGLRYGK